MSAPRQKRPYLFVEIEDGAKSTTKPTPMLRHEIHRRKVINDLQKLLKQSERRLKHELEQCARAGHRVRVDEPGFPYDLRYCYVCGASLGAI